MIKIESNLINAEKNYCSVHQELDGSKINVLLELNYAMFYVVKDIIKDCNSIYAKFIIDVFKRNCNLIANKLDNEILKNG